jgi:hypothetical protein
MSELRVEWWRGCGSWVDRSWLVARGSAERNQGGHGGGRRAGRHRLLLGECSWVVVGW